MRIPVIISLVGRFWQPATVRLSTYKYQMYTDTAGGGDILCASLRATVSLAIAGCPVWSVTHLFGPLPTTYTWGYYRSDVSCVFGNWIDRSHVARLEAVSHIVGSAGACRTIRGNIGFRLLTAADWFALRTCFHAQFNDPREPPSTRATDMAPYAGMGLTNVVLWDLAFLIFTRPTFDNNSSPSISTLLCAHLARFSVPNGPSQLDLQHEHVATGQLMAWYTDGLG